MKAQGLPLQLLTNSRLRVSIKEFASLSFALMELTQDESLGLLAKTNPLGCFHYYAKACFSSATMEESLTTWRDGINLVDNGITAYSCIESDKGYIALHCEKAPKVDDNYIVESLLLSFHRYHCWLANEFVHIERVDLNYPKPDYGDEHRFVFYGAPVHYNQNQNALHFSRKSLDLPCNRSRKEFIDLQQQPATHILTQPRQSRSISIKVRLWMEKIFREGRGFPVLEEASQHLGLSQQTLRRRLGASGYSFQKLKEDTRRDIAILYLKESEYSIEEIAFRLGFSEACTFIRAFKKWTGLTPLAYRKL